LLPTVGFHRLILAGWMWDVWHGQPQCVKDHHMWLRLPSAKLSINKPRR
jgi:hypothetical protein